MKNGLGQEIALDIWDIAEELHSRNIKLFIEWVPGHLEVEGNEKANKLTKKAVKQLIKSLYTSYTFLKRNIRLQSLIEWED